MGVVYFSPPPGWALACPWGQWLFWRHVPPWTLRIDSCVIVWPLNHPSIYPVGSDHHKHVSQNFIDFCFLFLNSLLTKNRRPHTHHHTSHSHARTHTHTHTHTHTPHTPSHTHVPWRTPLSSQCPTLRTGVWCTGSEEPPFLWQSCSMLAWPWGRRLGGRTADASLDECAGGNKE